MARERNRGDYSLVGGLTTEEGILRLGEVRAAVITESAFVLLQQVIHENAPEVVKYGFYETGYRAGIDLAQTARRPGESPEEAFRYFVEMYKQAGYGDMEVVEADLAKPEALLRGRNLLESTAAERSGIYRTPRAVDHYTRGMFAGLFSQLLGKEVICEEMKCTFRGDEYCEFLVLPFGAEE